MPKTMTAAQIEAINWSIFQRMAAYLANRVIVAGRNSAIKIIIRRVDVERALAQALAGLFAPGGGVWIVWLEIGPEGKPFLKMNPMSYSWQELKQDEQEKAA